MEVESEHIFKEKAAANYLSLLSSVPLLTGEHITEPELEECLMTLLGCSDNPEVEGSFTQSLEAALRGLPEKISAAHFAEELLGLSTQ